MIQEGDVTVSHRHISDQRDSVASMCSLDRCLCGALCQLNHRGTTSEDVRLLTTPLASARQSSPPLASCIAFANSVVTVPLLVEGMRPFGPRKGARPDRPIIASRDGWAITRVGSIVPSSSCENAISVYSLTSRLFEGSRSEERDAKKNKPTARQRRGEDQPAALTLHHRHDPLLPP